MNDLPPNPRETGERGDRGHLPRWPPLRRRPTRRPWLHGLLFLLTIVTTAYAPHFLDVDLDKVSSVADLFEPDFTYTFWILLILGSHEMGHYLACRYYRIPATLPFFIPGPPPIGTFGAVIRIRGIIPHRRALFDVAAAGPLAGFTLAFPLLVVGLARAQPVPLDAPVTGVGIVLGPPLISMLIAGFIFPDQTGLLEVGSLYHAGWVGMLVTSLNLFPVGQLDAGHIAYALSRRLHRILARVTLVLLFGLVAFQGIFISFPPSYLFWLLILLWMRDRHPRLADETGSVGPGRRAVAFFLLLVFLASFMPFPIVAR